MPYTYRFNGILMISSSHWNLFSPSVSSRTLHTETPDKSRFRTNGVAPPLARISSSAAQYSAGGERFTLNSGYIAGNVFKNSGCGCATFHVSVLGFLLQFGAVVALYLFQFALHN